jgi:hypothetical protein
MGITQQIGASSLIKSGVCTNATRPASPYEGQVIYETDTDKVFVYNGTAWKQIPTAATAGAILQVKNMTTGTSTSNATNSPVATAVTLSITPSSTTSTILVSGTTGNISKGAYRTWADMSIYRNSTNVNAIGYLFDQSTTATAASFSGQAFSYMDSPATTSSTTYTVYYLSALGGNIDVQGGHITLMEIAG